MLRRWTRRHSSLGSILRRKEKSNIAPPSSRKLPYYRLVRIITPFSLSAIGLIAALALPTTTAAAVAPPCGTDSQCAANGTNCPAGEGWILLSNKTVRCCRPSASDVREYYLFDFNIKIYNKSAGHVARCYGLVSYLPTHVRCYPTQECIQVLDPVNPSEGS